MIDLKHPLAVLVTCLPLAVIEAAMAPKLVHQAKRVAGKDLAGTFAGEFGGGISPAGRPRLPVRLMARLLYLKSSFNLIDEELVQRWAENVQWQFFSGMDHYEPRLPCDATQIGRFRRLLGEVRRRWADIPFKRPYLLGWKASLTLPSAPLCSSRTAP